MEKNCRLLKRLRILAVPMGLLMFVFTREGFGFGVALVLGLIATIAFDVIVKRELSRIVSEALVKTIENAIKETCDVQNIVEIQRISGGLIARVYLVNAAEKTAMINQAIKKSIDNCSLKKYLWAMQLMNMSGPGSVNEARKVLNKQLIEQLRQNKDDNER